MLPVCIHAGALGDGLPQRDLFVSPRHAVLLDGVLVPAGVLVNGVSVTQARAVEAVRYIHLELDRHAVIWADGAAAETFVDDNSRGMFQNAHEHAALFPDHRRVPAVYCAPRIDDGEALERIKRAIDLRAGLTVPGMEELLRGHVDGWEDTTLRGWAQNPGQAGGASVSGGAGRRHARSAYAGQPVPHRPARGRAGQWMPCVQGGAAGQCRGTGG